VLLSLVVLFLKALRGLFQIRRLLKREPPFGKLDVAILVYDVGQLVIWWYCAISGFLRPLHANWVNPIQWLTPSSYAFFLWAHIRAKRDKGTPVRGALRVALRACIVLAATNYITGLVYVSRRFKVDLGAGSYTPLDPFPELPASTTSACRDLLHNPASPLYSDPNSGRLTQVVMAGATTFVAIAWVPVLILALCFPLNVKRATALVTYGWGIAVQFIILIWLSLIDARGVPLMLHEGCGVVVIAMSSARGYYDSKLHYDGLRLQAAREAFGVCKSLSVQTGDFSQADCISQRRLYIYLITIQVLFALADGSCFHFCLFLSSFSQVSVRNVVRDCWKYELGVNTAADIVAWSHPHCDTTFTVVDICFCFCSRLCGISDHRAYDFFFFELHHVTVLLM
jgi:hypothetical protein